MNRNGETHSGLTQIHSEELLETLNCQTISIMSFNHTHSVDTFMNQSH